VIWDVSTAAAPAATRISAKGPKQDFWASSGTPYFTENPGDPYQAWDMSRTFDYLPGQYITFRWEYDYRAALRKATRALSHHWFPAGLRTRAKTKIASTWRSS